MAIWGNERLISEIKSGNLAVTPLGEKTIQPGSLDLTLGPILKEYKQDGLYIDPMHPQEGLMQELTIHPYGSEEERRTPFYIFPGESLLGTTTEYIKFPKYCGAFVTGRSSIGRLFVFVENAGYIDPGFEGEITFEIFNAGKNYIRLRAGMRIAQAVLMDAEGVTEGYVGKYQGQRGATASRLHLDEGR